MFDDIYHLKLKRIQNLLSLGCSPHREVDFTTLGLDERCLENAYTAIPQQAPKNKSEPVILESSQSILDIRTSPHMEQVQASCTELLFFLTSVANYCVEKLCCALLLTLVA